MSCRWPVMRATGLLLVDGSHRNIVKSSEPDASRSGRPPLAASYLGKRQNRNLETCQILQQCLPDKTSIMASHADVISWSEY